MTGGRDDFECLGSKARSTAGRAGAVYLVPHVMQSRFKVGWSLQPLRRITALPEYDAQHLNLSLAQVAWFAQAHRARQAERALHQGLALYSVRPDHTGDGCTEWFSTDGWASARSMLDLLPLGPAATGRPRLTPLLAAPSNLEWSKDAAYTPLAGSAVDAWYRVEDLWTRLSRLLPLAVEADRDDRRLFCIGLRRLNLLETLVLRAKALDIETYEWQGETARRSLVRLMDWKGDDLVLELTSSRQLQRWPEGPSVDDQMRGFLARHAVPRRADPTSNLTAAR